MSMDIPETLGRRPPRRRQGFRRFGLGAVIALLILLISLFRGASVFYTDYLWFGSVDMTDVWSGILLSKILLGVGAVALFAAIIWINLWIVDRHAPRTLSFNPEDELARRYQQFTRPRAKRIRTLVSLLLGFFVAAGFSTHWQEWLLFLHGGDFGIDDPQFGIDVGFFVFKLPFVTTLLNWTFYALILAIIVSLVGHYLQGAIRPQATSNRITSAVKAHVSVLLGLLALVRAGHYQLERYRLSYSERGPVTGANYTDVNYLLPALVLLIGISVLAAVMFFIGARRKGWSLPVITVALWAVVSLLVGVAIPAGVQALSVVPAESKKEAPYIKRNIDATRDAMNLDSIQVNDFKYDAQLSADALQKNAPTIRNVRLWDPAYLQPVYQRLQENRSFFRFNDVDVDRYVIDNNATQVELSVRELNPSGLPGDRRSWVNEHLQYTHGYGVVASPANAVTSNGNPDFIVKDVPPNGSLEIKKPQVYFGEHPNDYSIVNTDQAEVDYVSLAGRDEVSKYEGTGGVELSNIVKRAAFAARVGDLKPLISGLVNNESKALYYTNIRDRVIKAAPFLHFDGDPYPVISDGRILWMQDAYTTSNAYPYANAADTSQVEAARGGLKGAHFNYVRNSVKVTVDAYDGNMTFYVNDANDPIVKAWQKAFPKLFTDGSKMPETVRQHIRYPEDLFRVQSVMYGKYHMDNPQDFYSKSDQWNIAQKPAFGDATNQTTVVGPDGRVIQAGEDRIEPYYLLMKLPGDEKESFLMFQPFVPFSQNDQRKELSAFMTAKSDPDEYGKMQVFVMPRDRQVDGPALVEARIQQDPTIKQYITLLNQSGSRVQLGNMLIIPIENSLLYVRPLYITASQTGVPEFKKAIVVHGDQIKMEDTLQQALAKIFGSAPQTQEEARAPGASDTPVTPGASTTTTTSTTIPGVTGTQPATSLPPAEVQALLDQADQEFRLANDALRAGNLAAYQDHLNKVQDLLRRARGS